MLETPEPVNSAQQEMEDKAFEAARMKAAELQAIGMQQQMAAWDMMVRICEKTCGEVAIQAIAKKFPLAFKEVIWSAEDQAAVNRRVERELKKSAPEMLKSDQGAAIVDRMNKLEK